MHPFLTADAYGEENVPTIRLTGIRWLNISANNQQIKFQLDIEEYADKTQDIVAALDVSPMKKFDQQMTGK